MKCCLVYDFTHLRLEFWEVPEGQCLDDVAGKYFSMDHGEDGVHGEGILSWHENIAEAKLVAKEKLQADLKRVSDKLDSLYYQKPSVRAEDPDY